MIAPEGTTKPGHCLLRYATRPQLRHDPTYFACNLEWGTNQGGVCP